MKVAKENREGTPFADAREIKIGTHCADGGVGPVGRLRDETAVYREVLAYETMQLLGFLTPRVRRCQIVYRDTTAPSENSSTGWEINRDALILDDQEVVAERIGGRALSDEEKEALVDAKFDPQLVIDIHFFHALIGNWDYSLSVDGRETWNTDVIEGPDKRLIPLPGDFDLASWITGKTRQMAPFDYHPELDPIEREARYKLETIQGKTTAEQFTAAALKFEQNRAAIEGKIQASNMDDAGRENAMKHVAFFFSAQHSITRR
jgi:hypothetical protein